MRPGQVSDDSDCNFRSCLAASNCDTILRIGGSIVMCGAKNGVLRPAGADAGNIAAEASGNRVTGGNAHSAALRGARARVDAGPGLQAPEGWWHPAQWRALAAESPEWLHAQVGGWRTQVLGYNAQVEALAPSIEAQVVPVGLGALTAAPIEAEITMWSRFKNRR